MNHYKVKALSVGGTGKVFYSGDVVKESQFPEGHAEDYVKSKHLTRLTGPELKEIEKQAKKDALALEASKNAALEAAALKLKEEEAAVAAAEALKLKEEAATKVSKALEVFDAAVKVAAGADDDSKKAADKAVIKAEKSLTAAKEILAGLSE